MVCEDALERCDRKERELKKEGAAVKEAPAGYSPQVAAEHVRLLTASAFQMLKRERSNLLTANGLCTEDIGAKGKLLYAASVMDPSNQYAINEGMNLLRSVNQYNAALKAQQQQQQQQQA